MQDHGHTPHWIFKLGIFLNVAFFVSDMAVWYFFGSSAIFGDSIHNGLHALAHFFALHGHGLEGSSSGAMESSESKLRKYQSAQRIGYLIIAGAILIAVFGGMQIYNPKELASGWMISMASLDIASNAVLLWFLWRYRKYDPEVRALFADIKIDSLASLGVIIGGTVILFVSYYRVDGIVAIPIALIALRTAKRVIVEARAGIHKLQAHINPH